MRKVPVTVAPLTRCSLCFIETKAVWSNYLDPLTNGFLLVGGLASQGGSTIMSLVGLSNEHRLWRIS